MFKNGTVKIDGSRTVFIDFSDDAVKIIGCQFIVKFVKNFTQRGSGDVSVTYSVIDNAQSELSNSIK